MNRMKKSVGRKSVERDTLCCFLSEILDLKAVADRSSNGLQVEGSEEVKRVGLAVDACIEAFQQASRRSCEMLIVHHGIIWEGLTAIKGSVRRQIEFLLNNGISLFAAHLPLDLHPTLGNNAQLARIIGLKGIKRFGVYKGVTIGIEGTARPGLTRDVLVETLCRSLDTECTVLPFGKADVRRIAVVSGRGGSVLAEAISKGVDCFVSGEPVHENYHEALEAGVNVIYAGHYHTEKGGVQAIGKLLEKRFGITTEFIDVPTPI